MRKLKKKLKRYLNEIGSENDEARANIRKILNFYWLLHYKFNTFYLKTDPKTVIFASFEGRSYSDSPRALFEYMVKSQEFNDYTLVFAFRTKVKTYRKQINKFVDEIYPGFEDDREHRPGPEIHVVKYHGKAWRQYLKKSKYWVFNFKIDDYLKPTKNQIFLQTWHGTPLKRLGFDLEHFDSATNTLEGIKKRYEKEIKKFDIFLTPSPFATEKFISAYRMNDFGRTDIILETGYPRNDILTNYTAQDVVNIKNRIFGYFYLPYEKLTKKKTIILYAPTYRPNEYELGKGRIFKSSIDWDRIQKEFGDDCIILFRAHYFVANLFNFDKYQGFIYNVSDLDDINELYLISDLMITDYSSSMFDYSILKRPMIFYMYDYDHYKNESNGFYFEPEEVLPGPIVKTEDDLIEAIKDSIDHFEYTDKYKEFNDYFDPYDDGHVCERVVNEVFKGGSFKK